MSRNLSIKLAAAAATLLLIATLTEVQGAPTQSLRSGAYFCGTDGTCLWYKPGDPDWVFGRFSYLMGYADCANSIAEWRAKSPGCRIVLYTSGSDLPPYKLYSSNSYGSGQKPTYIRDRMAQLGEIEENAYLHFYNDTKLVNWTGTAWDTVLIHGTNSMMITAKDSVSRVPNSYVSALFISKNTYSGATRLAPNFTNSKLRLAYKEFITQAFNAQRLTHWPTMTGYWDGMYFDNYSPLALQGSHLASGGLVVESGTSPTNLLTFGTAAYGAWGWGWMKIFGREVRDTLRTSAQWSADGKKKVLAYNVGISFRNEYMYPDSTGADALNYEFAFDPVACANNSFYRLENLYTRDSIATLNGATFFWCSRPRADNGLFTKQQAIYNNLSFYYAARTDSTWIYMRPEPGPRMVLFMAQALILFLGYQPWALIWALQSGTISSQQADHHRIGWAHYTKSGCGTIRAAASLHDRRMTSMHRSGARPQLRSRSILAAPTSNSIPTALSVRS